MKCPICGLEMKIMPQPIYHKGKYHDQCCEKCGVYPTPMTKEEIENASNK